MISCGYCDAPEGQIHFREAGEAGENPALICLHPAPFSGLAFSTIMPHLAKDRRVIAPDFPGHGGSHAFKPDASIADYAAAISALVDQTCDGGPVDLFGFHTGTLAAVELSRAAPEKVRRMVLCDVPALEPEMRAELLESNGAPPAFTPDLASLDAAWERGITRRIESQGMARSFAMFVEQLRHGEAMNAGFHAGFSYPLEQRFGEASGDITMLASHSMLLDATRRAAALIPDAKLVERLDITRAVLDEAAPQTAAAVLEILAK